MGRRADSQGDCTCPTTSSPSRAMMEQAPLSSSKGDFGKTPAPLLLSSLRPGGGGYGFLLGSPQAQPG